MGRNCRFLQGPETEAESVRKAGFIISPLNDSVSSLAKWLTLEVVSLFQIREAIKAERSCTVRLLNYKWDFRTHYISSRSSIMFLMSHFMVIRDCRKDGTPFWNSLHIAPVRKETYLAGPYSICFPCPPALSHFNTCVFCAIPKAWFLPSRCAVQLIVSLLPGWDFMLGSMKY